MPASSSSIGDLLVLEELHHELVVGRGHGLDQLGPPLDGLVLQVVGDVDLVPAGAEVLGLPDERLHVDEVDDAGEVALVADGQLQHGGVGPEALLDRVERVVEVGAEAVHLVDEAHAGHAVLVGLAPHRLGLGLDAGDAVEHGDGTVEHAQRTLDLDGEVDVAGRVDDVDGVVLPHAGGGRGGDGDPPLLLLLHPVHGGAALVDLADLVVAPGVVEDPLGGRGLAGVDVGHDPDVAELRRWSCCAFQPLMRTLTEERPGDIPRGRARSAGPGAHVVGQGAGLPAVVGEGLVGLGHLVHVFATLHRGTEAVGGVEDLVGEALGHGALAAGAGVGDDPAEGQRGGPAGLDLDGHLVGGAADTTALDLELGLDVVDGPLEGRQRLLAGLGRRRWPWRR